MSTAVFWLRVAVFAAAVMAGPVFSQSATPAGPATLQGYVRDSANRAVANATVLLQLTTGALAQGMPARATHTNSGGAYRFSSLGTGPYTLSVEMAGYDRVNVDSLRLAAGETRTIAVTLVASKRPAATPRPTAPAPEFFDEPQFTVAGVTQTSDSGGHGSDTVRRTTEALAKAAVSLSKDSAKGADDKESAAAETSLRDKVRREPDNFEANRALGSVLAAKTKHGEALPFLQRAARLNPQDGETHRLLGAVAEQMANPLEAVREFQRAAELDPSEPNLFEWGTELLRHRAFEPATEVFAQGNRRFPDSVRMLVALGAAWYSRGSYEQATVYLTKASDLDPEDPTPYLFLGRVQAVEATAGEESVRRLARFAQAQPENALANYYYAMALSKQGAGDSERWTRVEARLQKTVRLDPKLAAAYLQLGILYSQREDFVQAIAEYRKAIEVAELDEVDDTLEVAHYRLAQAYRRTGDEARAEQEFRRHDECAQKTKEQVERERRETQQFVISVSNKHSATQPQH